MSLVITLALAMLSSSFAQVSIIEELTDFVKNTNIEFLINNQRVGQQIPVYAENQDVGFSIVSQTSGYHYLYVVSGEGSSSLIYPNQFETEAYIQAGVQTDFPSANTYRLIAQNGQGTDFHIVSIVSPTPLTGFTIGFTNGFNIIPPPTQVIPGYQAAAMRYRVQASSQTGSSCNNNCLYLSPAPVLVQPPVYMPTTTTATNAAVNTTTTAVTSSTDSYQGFATHQEYLDNFYAQSGTSASNATVQPTTTNQSPTYTYTTPATTYTTPNVNQSVNQVAVTPVPTTNTNYSVPNYAANAASFQGFASYQAYLDNYYAQNGTTQSSTQNINQTPTQAPAVTQTNTYPTLNIGTPVTVYTTQIGVNAPANNTTTVTTSTPPATTGAFQGYASYQAYLDSFYAQNTTTANTNPVNTNQTSVATDPFAGFGSYDAYLANYQATVGALTTNNNATNNYSVYNVVPTQTTQAPNYAVDYSITQQQVQNNQTNYTQLSPQPYTQPYTQPAANQTPIINTNYNQPGFFDFEVGRNYTLFQSLGITVLSIQDNRCPAGVQCFQAGNVIANVQIEFGGVKRSFTITILPNDEPSIGVGNSSLRFIGVSDYASNALRVHIATR